MSTPLKIELPVIDSKPSETFIGLARGSYVMEVTDEAAQIVPPAKFTRWGIQNRTKVIGTSTVNVDSVFLGGSDVDSGKGWEIAPGDSRNEDSVLTPYIVAATGKTIDVIIEWAI